MKQIFHFRLALVIMTLTLFLAGGANYLQQREIVRLEELGRQDAQLIDRQQVEIADLRKELARVSSSPASAIFSADHLELNAAFQKDLNQLHVSDDPAVDTVAAQALSAINKGASPNVASNEGIRALHIAAFLDDGGLAESAIQHGADVNARDSDGFTPLHVCAMVGSPAVARLLAANGADKNAKDKDGKIPLQRAEENDQMQLVLILRAAK